jgi:arylsulfatase A-like enzyme/Flp pilus assembly protein TadD
MSQRKTLVALALSLTLSLRPVYAQPEIKRTSDLNVLLITLDTTRADHIGCYGYLRAKTPTIDQLARDGVKFVNAYAQVPLTLPSHSSIMTGTYPLYHQVHDNGYYYLGSENETLAKILKKNGYKTAAFVSSFTVDSRFGIGQGFDLYDDKFLDDEILKNFRSERKADKVFASFSPWFDKNYSQKFCCWVHLYDPHLPYDPPPPFKQEFYDHPYDGEIAFADFYLGKIIAKLKEKNILGKTLIVIAGDHGEALGEKRELDHGFFLYEDTLRVPLIFCSSMALPQGTVIYPRARLIDVLPTILDLIKISVPKETQGTTLLPYITGQKKEPLTSYIETYFPLENFGWSPLLGLVDGEWKYIQAPRPELYNLKSDPREENNLFERETKVAKDEAGKLAEVIRRYSRNDPQKKRTLTPEEEERLRSLGYIGGGGASKASGQSLSDPKDKIEDYILYFRGNLMETEGQFEKAAECYREVNRRNPEAPWFYVNLGMLDMKMNKVADAVQILEQARAKFPDSLMILSRLMSFYLRAERWDDGFATGQAILKLDPRNFDALFLAGSVTAKMGKWEEALSFYKKALEIEPENKILRQRRAYALAAQGRSKEALDLYSRLKEEYPADVSIDLELGQVYELLGDRGKAHEILSRAVEGHPSPETYYAYAIHVAKSGDLKKAVPWLKKYLETTPEVDTPRKNKARETLAQWEKSLKD